MKKIFVFFLFIILTFPAYKALRHPGLISGHDSESAVFRSEEYFQALADGQIPPRWAKRINYGLGQPSFTFVYQLPFVLSSGLIGIGLTPVNAYKLILAASFPLGGFFAYLWLRNKYSDTSAFLAGLVYAYTPYQFANVYVRGAIGEVVAGTLLPLSFLLLDATNDKPTKKSIALLAIVISLIILSHQFYGIIFGLVWFFYSKNISSKFGLIWGYLICSYYLIPVIIWKKFTFLDEVGKYIVNSPVFVNLSRMIDSKWGFESVGSNTNPMSVNIGMFNLLGIFGSLRFLKNSKVSFFITIFLVCVFMMLPLSYPLWKISGPFGAIQFPWRLLFVIRLASTFLFAVFVFKLLNKFNRYKLIICLCFVGGIIYFSRNFWSVGVYKIWTDVTVNSLGYPGTYTLLKEETPIWHSVYDEYNQLGKYKFYKSEKGDFEVNPEIWKSNYHKFIVSTPLGGIFSDMTHFWPGWEAYIDGKKVDLFDPTNEFSHGLLTMNVTPGKHVIETRLVEPLVNKIANMISLVSIGIAFWWMIRWRKV